MISTSACVADGPAIETARSPDSRVSRNASVITVNATSTPIARRRAIRRNITKTPGPASAPPHSQTGQANATVSPNRRPTQERVGDCGDCPRQRRPVAMTAMCVPTQNVISRPYLIEEFGPFPDQIEHEGLQLKTPRGFGALLPD